MAYSVVELPKSGRITRRPQHTFQIRHTPYAIQPFFIAPVLPGETMRNLLMQARVVTDPVKHPLVGWWIEYYYFYVKHRDLEIRDQLSEMVLDATWSASAAGIVDADPNPAHYFCGGGIDWVKHCLQRVVEEYFRNEGEAWNDFMIDGLPAASITGNSWLDSVMPAAEYSAPDVEIDVEDGLTASEIESARQQWAIMRTHGLTNMTYEDFLRSYGVRAPLAEEPHVPELVRYVRDWSYPTNTVDPTTGNPSSAVSWSVAERADKDRFFSEPGFLFGVTVARPKVYLKGQKGAAVWLMRNLLSWLPAILQNDPHASMQLVADGTGPLGDVADAGGYVVDIRDILMYGDQFANFDLAADANASAVPLPTAELQKRYVTALDDVKALFKSAEAYRVRQDGVVHLTIAGSQRDTSPRVNKVRLG